MSQGMKPLHSLLRLDFQVKRYLVAPIVSGKYLNWGVLLLRDRLCTPARLSTAALILGYPCCHSSVKLGSSAVHCALSTKSSTIASSYALQSTLRQCRKHAYTFSIVHNEINARWALLFSQGLMLVGFYRFLKTGYMQTHLVFVWRGARAAR